MLTIGVAGHIDHGKTSLIKLLTSVDTDRLPEEKERGMTIDLGFAWLPIDGGDTVGIVDVPGHKHFVHNVIPGLYGIDAVILVVAADDGWMPQTEEHARIIDLLGLKHGIIALTKIDLVEDNQWLDMVEKDIQQQLESTDLKNTPIVRLSNKDGSGAEKLKQTIEEMVQKLAVRQDIGKPRLPVDRVFTMKGSGVVVTGTLSYGCFNAGDEVIISPGGKKAHIRSAESYKQKHSKISPGSRTALNLSGIKKEELQRGDIIIGGDSSAAVSKLIDGQLTLLEGFKLPLKNGSEADVFLETKKVTAKVILLGEKVLKPGQKGMVQLRLVEDISTYIGERFILRRQSPPQTIGGGVVLDPFPVRHKVKEFSAVTAMLEKQLELQPKELIKAKLAEKGYSAQKDLLKASYFSQTEVSRVVSQMEKNGELLSGTGYIISATRFAGWQRETEELLETAHKQNPLSRGVSRAELRVKLDLLEGVYGQLLESLVTAGKVSKDGEYIVLARFGAALSQQQDKLEQSILTLLEKNPQNPPSKGGLKTNFPGGQTVIGQLIKRGTLIELPEDFILSGRRYTQIKEKVVSYLKENGQISVKDINTLFGFSRKYSIPLLTRLDRDKITRRQDNVRVLGP